jgi:hypothetical protein
MKLQPHDHLKSVFDQLLADGYSGRVKVWLQGGIEIVGTVGETGNHAVVIKALSGREYFDAHVRYEHVTCVEAQTRT